MHRSIVAPAALAMALLAPLSGPALSAEAATLTGAVKAPLTLDEAVLSALPAVTLDISFETSKGPETGTYTGVLLLDLLNRAELVNEPGNNAALRHTMMITGSDGYAVAVAMGEIDPKFAARQVLVAYKGTDPEVSFDHLRVLVPGDLHGGRAVKDVVQIDVR